MNRITGSLERLLETKAKGTIHRHPLSFREKAIVIAIARNRSCNQIANEMGIAHKTVSEYRQRASLKMGVWESRA
jgi:DNA-binding NarL/FixJ family response regulator